MSSPDPTLPPASDLRDAGTILRETREAAGLSLDMVSQQLKLAPRQVKALEDGEFELLPGRTFVRGFARNYARLLQLDPDAIVEALPGGAGRSGLEAPTLNPTAVTMGELPSAATGVPGWLRPLAIVVVVVLVAAAGGYALWQNHLQRAAPATAPAATAPTPLPATTAPATAAAPAAPAAPPASSDATPAGTALPNPAISAPLDSGEPASPASATAPPGASPAPQAAPALAPAPPAGAGTNAAPIAPITVTVRTASWVEVKDGSGRTVVSQTVQPGQSPSIVGSPPFDIVIGNAPDVTLTYRGQPVDLTPYTRGSVARFSLK